MSETATILPGLEPRSIALAEQALRDGACIGMPTETVYGLACDALNPEAVARVFAAKQRPSFDPLIVHVSDANRAQQLATFCEPAYRLAERFWPGPLTLVLPRAVGEAGEPIVPDLVTAGLPRVGLRVPDHPVAQLLLSTTKLALAAPSANRFGSVSPTTAPHVASELGGRIPLILDGGACRRGVESTVVGFGEGKAVRVLRLGGVTVEAIQEALPGYTVALTAPTSRPGQGTTEGGRPSALPSPGMTDRHYAPRTPLRFLPANTGEALPAAPAGRWGLIVLSHTGEPAHGFAHTRVLSPGGDLAEAAANLFAFMRELDGLGLDGIVAVGVPEEGLGRAINDRLRRASTSSA